MGDNSRMAEGQALYREQKVKVLRPGQQYTRVALESGDTSESFLVPTADLVWDTRSERS